MNKNPKTEHLTLYKWQKGVSGNPAGRPKSYITLLKEMGITKEVLAVMVAEIAFMPFNELEQLTAKCSRYSNIETTEPAIRLAIAVAFRKAARDGEYDYIAPWMRLLIGSPSANVKV